MVAATPQKRPKSAVIHGFARGTKGAQVPCSADYRDVLSVFLECGADVRAHEGFAAEIACFVAGRDGECFFVRAGFCHCCFNGGEDS